MQVIIPSIPIFDQDAGDYSSFTLVKVTATPDDGSDVTSLFSVNEANGAVSLTRPGLDFEYQRVYTLVISAQDHVRSLCVPSQCRRVYQRTCQLAVSAVVPDGCPRRVCPLHLPPSAPLSRLSSTVPQLFLLLYLLDSW
jgi:hypothetical protein